MHWQLKLAPLYINLPEPIVGEFKYTTEYNFQFLSATEEKQEILYTFSFHAFIDEGKAELEYGGEILSHFDEPKEFEEYKDDPASIPSAMKFDVMFSTRNFFEAMSFFFNIDSYV